MFLKTIIASVQAVCQSVTLVQTSTNAHYVLFRHGAFCFYVQLEISSLMSES